MAAAEPVWAKDALSARSERRIGRDENGEQEDGTV